MIKLKHPEYNFVLAIDQGYSKELFELLDETGLPYYLNKVITTIDQFQGLIKTNVTDILIGENLGFHLGELRFFAQENNKKLRAFVNVAQSSWSDKESSITDFFIRPNDIKHYALCIDTFEFWEETERQNILYEIYVKDGFWYGNLNEIISGYKGNTYNENILPIFVEKRINCGKKCMYGYDCNWCNRIQKLASTLTKKDLVIRPN